MYNCIVLRGKILQCCAELVYVSECELWKVYKLKSVYCPEIGIV